MISDQDLALSSVLLIAPSHSAPNWAPWKDAAPNSTPCVVQGCCWTLFAAVLFRYCGTALWLMSVAHTVIAFGSWLILCHGAALLFLFLDAFQPTLTLVLDLVFLPLVTTVLLFKLSFCWLVKEEIPLVLVSRNVSPISGLLAVPTFFLLCVFSPGSTAILHFLLVTLSPDPNANPNLSGSKWPRLSVQWLWGSVYSFAEFLELQLDSV